MAFTITVPAADMRDRAVGTRKSLVAQYIQPQKPFPLTTFAMSSSTTPTSPAATRTMIARGLLQTTGGHLTNTGTPFDAPYTIEMNGQNIRISVAIPRVIDWIIDFGSDHLTITRTANQTPDPNPLIVTFIDQPVVGGVVVPITNPQILTQVDLRDVAMTYVLQDQSNPGNTLIIKLDFTSSIASTKQRKQAMVASLLLLSSLMALWFIVSCDTPHVAPPGPFPGSISCNSTTLHSSGSTSCSIQLLSSAPSGQQTINLKSSSALLTLPSSALPYTKPQEIVKACTNAQPPSGYAIVGFDQNFSCSQDATAFAEYVLELYTDKNQGDTMEICYPPQSLPDGTWASHGTDNASLSCRTYASQFPIPPPTIIAKVSGQGTAPSPISFTVNAGTIPTNQQATIQATVGSSQPATVNMSLTP